MGVRLVVREFTRLGIAYDVRVPVFESEELPVRVVDPVDDTVALRDPLPVGELVDVFDSRIERVPVTLLRNVVDFKGDSEAVLVVSVVRVLPLDEDGERDDLNETVALELPVDVFETVTDDVCVRVRTLVYDDLDVAEFDVEAVILFDLSGEYDAVAEELGVLDDTTEREFVGLAVDVLVLLIEPVVVFDTTDDFDSLELEVPVFVRIDVSVC